MSLTEKLSSFLFFSKKKMSNKWIVSFDVTKRTYFLIFVLKRWQRERFFPEINDCNLGKLIVE